MKKNKKYTMNKYYQEDCGPKGDIGIQPNGYDFGYDFGDDVEEYEESNSYDYVYDYDRDVSIDSVEDNCSDDFHFYDEHYDNLFDGKSRGKKEASKLKNISHRLSDDEIAGFERVKTYYNANIEANQKKKDKITSHIIMSGLLIIGFFSVTSYLTFHNIATNQPSLVYVSHETGKISDLPDLTISENPAISINDINVLRKQINKDTGIIVNKPISEPVKEVQREEPKVVAPSIVNNYNFEQLNTGLTTLGYSLLGCLAAFMSFKGLSLLARSHRLKKEIKKSKSLLNQFKAFINSNDNQLETSQLISEQIILNNIFIERLSSNNNVVELIAVNEKLKDTNSFINDHLIKNLKGE